MRVLDVLQETLVRFHEEVGVLPVSLTLPRAAYDKLLGECEAMGIKPVKRPGFFDPFGEVEILGHVPSIELTTTSGPVRIERAGQ